MTDDGPEPEAMLHERPRGRGRAAPAAPAADLAARPIVALAAIGSLMFAFPLAFEFGDGGAVIAMLGPADLLLRGRLGHDGRPPGRLHVARAAARAAPAADRTGGSSLALRRDGRGGGGLAVWRVARLR